MKTKCISLLLISVFCFVALVIGCQKSPAPFGITAPMGLDRPTYTPTPTSGSFNIYVVDGTTLMGGVTVFLVDPTGNTITSVTQNMVGYAPFNVSSIKNGIWTAGVSQQSYFGYSTIPITITNNSGGNYYLSAASQSFAVSNITSPQYYAYNSQTILSYGVSYSQPGNLNEPVSLSYGPVSSLPTGWNVSFYPPVLGTGTGVNSGTVTVIIPANPCAIEQPVLYFTGTKLNSTVAQPNYIQSNPTTITKNFITNVKLIQTYKTPTSGFSGPVSLRLASTSDCGMTWSVSWSLYFNGSLQSQGNGSLANGGNVWIAGLNSTDGGYTVHATVSGAGYSLSGSGALTFNNGDNTTIINSNF